MGLARDPRLERLQAAKGLLPTPPSQPQPENRTCVPLSPEQNLQIAAMSQSMSNVLPQTPEQNSAHPGLLPIPHLQAPALLGIASTPPAESLFVSSPPNPIRSWTRFDSMPLVQASDSFTNAWANTEPLSIRMDVSPTVNKHFTPTTSPLIPRYSNLIVLSELPNNANEESKINEIINNVPKRFDQFKPVDTAEPVIQETEEPFADEPSEDSNLTPLPMEVCDSPVASPKLVEVDKNESSSESTVREEGELSGSDSQSSDYELDLGITFPFDHRNIKMETLIAFIDNPDYMFKQKRKKSKSAKRRKISDGDLNNLNFRVNGDNICMCNVRQSSSLVCEVCHKICRKRVTANDFVNDFESDLNSHIVTQCSLLQTENGQQLSDYAKHLGPSQGNENKAQVPNSNSGKVKALSSFIKTLSVKKDNAPQSYWPAEEPGEKYSVTLQRAALQNVPEEQIQFMLDDFNEELMEIQDNTLNDFTSKFNKI